MNKKERKTQRQKDEKLECKEIENTKTKKIEMPKEWPSNTKTKNKSNAQRFIKNSVADSLAKNTF